MVEAQLTNGFKFIPRHFAGFLNSLYYGKVFYVDSVNGSDLNSGRIPSKAFATLQAAINASTANKAEVIILLPGHAETLTTASAITVNKAGLRIVSAGIGSRRATFTFTTAVAASLNITASNVNIENCIFTCGIDAQTAMINVTGSDVTFLGNDFNTNSGTVGAILGILTAATADRLTVINNRFLGAATNTGTTTTAQIQHEVGVDYVIKENYFTGKMTQAILNATTILRGLIQANIFVVATGTKGISVAAASTPMIANNRFNVPSGTAPIVAAAGFVAGNVYSAAAGVTAGTAATI